MRYEPSWTLLQARDKYLAANGFSALPDFSKFAKIKAGPFSFYIPNTKSRRDAIKIHDLHHVLNEYDTTWIGEAEIGAWEIASGIPTSLWYATVLNLAAAAIGVLISPARVWVAFQRGRKCRNLYQTLLSNPDLYAGLLQCSVMEARKELFISL